VTIAELLLTRQGLLSLAPDRYETAPAPALARSETAPAPALDRYERAPALLRALDIELAALGYALSTRLRRRLATLAPEDLARSGDWMRRVLAEDLGATHKHEPLFRDFPRGIPDDTFDLWVRKVLIHFVQAPGQPCLFCRRIGTTHVLNPCLHVVCDRCFDGANYSACPVCEHHVDRRSPFFKPSRVRLGLRLPSPAEPVTFKLLDLGEGDEVEGRRLFLSLCARRQALSPMDGDALTSIVQEYGERVLDWLPREIPVKENIAALFGALLKRGGDPEKALARARAYLTTATDVLRLLAALSGADPALQGQMVYREVERELHGRTASIRVPAKIRRFEMARLNRPLRRRLLAILDELEFERLVEDMSRHRSYWIWAGEFLHPFEYAGRFPRAALAFAVLRETQPGDDALGARLRDDAAGRALESTLHGSYAHRGYYARLERAASRGDSHAFTRLLAERPGELARRLDHALRVALSAGEAPNAVVDAYVARTARFSTPVLVTLLGFLPRRAAPAPIRLFWPKGRIAKGVSSPDKRPPLPQSVIAPLVDATERELLRRFADKPAFADGMVDRALAEVVAPFNERSASRSAVSLPRGSRVRVPDGQTLRLFLHWRQPEAGGRPTDLDLSVAFYDDAWRYVGVCSYYQLKFDGRAARGIALSAGDLRDAPYPDGATEFVDAHRERARVEGIRYAVMVVNSYAGMPFSALDRAYAGLMLRSDAEGVHFDPGAVALTFDLQGDNGVFLPMVVDIQEDVMHWLDVYSTGQLEFNNVENSNAAIRKICPEMIAYFGSGARSSVYDLALLHAAARCANVHVRGEAGVRRFSRGPAEPLLSFYRRILAGEAEEERRALPVFTGGVFACLFHGDVDLPAGSVCYALFRERQTSVIAASDLLS